MAQTTAVRLIMAAGVAAALVLSSAGACGPTGSGADDDAPAPVTTQLPDGDGSADQPDDAGPADAGTDDAGPDDAGTEGGEPDDEPDGEPDGESDDGAGG